MPSSQDPWLKRWPDDQLPELEKQQLPLLRGQLLSWQPRHGRHDLPWHTRDPYGVWVSEVMLQQTQVATGLYRYPAWMARFPTIEALALASEAEVLSAWEGLGYYNRARNLHAAARRIVAVHGGAFPRSRADRLALPGVGPSTASAIGAFAFGEREAIFDGNVARVWSRWWGSRPLPERPADQVRFWWGWAQAATPETPGDIRTWTQGIMDLGATVCTPKKPSCPSCPWKTTCRAFALGTPQAWPLKKPKAERKDWVLPWVWDVNEQGLAVVQRPPGGPWEGLWTLPEAPGALGSEIAKGRHELSHRRIQWSISQTASAVEPSGVIRRVGLAEWEALALPRPLRRWWTELSPEQRLMLFGLGEEP